MAILSYPLETFRPYAGSFTWQPFVRFSRSTVLSLLTRIDVGQILVTDSDGTRTVCGAPQPKDGTPRTELWVLKESFWVRVLLFADMVSVIFGGYCSRREAEVLARRDLQRASCWASFRVPIWLLFSRYACR